LPTNKKPSNLHVEEETYRACLVARKWGEVRKLGSIISHFPIYLNTGKGK